jgi:flagellar FliL protein
VEDPEEEEDEDAPKKKKKKKKRVELYNPIVQVHYSNFIIQ